MSQSDPLQQQLAALRRAFDQAFARPVASADGRGEDLLLLRAGQERLACRVGELAAVERIEKIVPLPGSDPRVLGLAGVHGRVVAVYHLAAILGQGTRAGGRWIAVLRNEESVGLAFDDFDGLFRAGQEHFSASANPGAPAYTRHAVQAPGGAVFILETAAVLAALRPAAAAPAISNSGRHA